LTTRQKQSIDTDTFCENSPQLNDEKYKIKGTVGVNRDIDLALLQIEGIKVPALRLGNSRSTGITNAMD